MKSRLHIVVFLGLTSAAWAALLLLRGVPIAWAHLWPFGLVVSFLVLVVTVFDRYAWAWPILQGWYVERPDLRGTWRVTLQTQWKDPATGQIPGPNTCYMAVRQTHSSLSMRLMTAESASWLVAQNIVVSEDGLFQVTGVYMNEPELHLRGVRSEIHYGAILLDVHGQPPTDLQGKYWTDRQTRGTMQLTDRRKDICPTYAAARTVFGDTA